MFEYCCCAHIAEQEFTFVCYHAFCLAVNKFTVQFCAVPKNNQDMRTFSESMMQHE